MRHALIRQPRSAVLWLLLGLCFGAVSNKDGARAAFRKALQLDSRNLSARICLANALCHEGNFIDAAQLCFEGLAEDVASMELHQALAETFMQANLLEQAEKVVRDAAALDGKGVSSGFLTARLLYRRHRIDECLETLAKVLVVAHDHLPARWLQGEALLAAGRTEFLRKPATQFCDSVAAATARWQALLKPCKALKVDLVWAEHAAHSDVL